MLTISSGSDGSSIMRLTKNIIITQPTAAYGVLTRGTHKAEFATNRSHSFDTSNRTKSPMQQWSKCSVRGRNLPGNFQWDLRKYWQTNGRHVGIEASADLPRPSTINAATQSQLWLMRWPSLVVFVLDSYPDMLKTCFIEAIEEKGRTC